MEGLIVFSCLVNEGTQQLVIFQKRISAGDSAELLLPPQHQEELEFVTTYPQILHDIAGNFLIPLDVIYPEDEEGERIDVTTVNATAKHEKDRIIVRFASAPDTVFLTSPVAYVCPASKDFRLALPTLLACDSETVYPMDIFTLNTTKMAGKSITPKPTAFRWDLFKCMQFPALRLMRHYTCADRSKEFNCHIHFQTEDTVRTQAKRKTYISGDGSVFVDNTNLRVISYQEHGLSTMPLVCNCYVTREGATEPYYFGSEIGGCTFDEIPGKLRMTTQHGRVFYIDTTVRRSIDARDFVYFTEPE